jgi:pyruvate dehydrogenase E2 component (dihydrolipoamide acetyltransferase)
MAEAYTLVPLSPLRKVIAARMVEAKRTIPHFRLVADLEVDALLELRRELNDQSSEVRLSLNDLLIKACALALKEAPDVNVQWAEDGIHRYHHADISIVTAIDGGLATPIICHAESKTVWEIAREARALAARAAKHALRMDEVFGGTFSVSNLGMYGVAQFDAIINPPQCAILAVGCAKPQVAVSPEREVRITTMMRVTLSVDHRAIDGATAAAFLAALRGAVEQPAQLRPAREEIG